MEILGISAFLLISILFLYSLIHDLYICFVTFQHVLPFLHHRLLRIMGTSTSLFPECNIDMMLGSPVAYFSSYKTGITILILQDV